MLDVLPKKNKNLSLSQEIQNLNSVGKVTTTDHEVSAVNFQA